jgi:uncharacterized protein (TIGR02266 family)
VNTTAVVALKTVLVADDTAFVRDRFKTALETAGHRALTARTGPEVLSAFREHGTSVDLIVLDLRLPQANGVALLRALRKLSTSLPPIVVFSGTIASADEVRALAALEVAGYLNEYTAVQHIVPSLTPHLFPGEYNRRSSPRVVLGVPIAYRFANTIATSLTLNISRGGLALRTTNPLDTAVAVRARFRLPGAAREVEAEARVTWSDPRVGMGLQFTKVDPTSQAAIDEFVQAHFFSNRKA